MNYRKLGRTQLNVGAIGFGAEYVWHESYEKVDSVVSYALDHGVNYIDLFMGCPTTREHFGRVLKGRRDQVFLAGHLGCAEQDGQYMKTRDHQLSLQFINAFYEKLQTDYIDVLFLHNVDEADDFETMFGDDGLLPIAQRLQAEGRVRYLGFSSHKVPIALRAVESGLIDVLMFPVNPVFDAMSASTGLEILWEDGAYQHAMENIDPQQSDRKNLYHACSVRDVGIVAMKPYAAGWLFNPDNPSKLTLTPVQCLHYVLSQPGVSTAVPGCKNVEEMQAALDYLEATPEAKDYSSIHGSSLWQLRKSCMYCNHCQPCPVGIDIGQITRLADTATIQMTDGLRAQYADLAVKASACLQCGSCTNHCPFGIEAEVNITRAAMLFE